MGGGIEEKSHVWAKEKGIGGIHRYFHDAKIILGKRKTSSMRYFSDSPSITCISPRRFALADDLDDLSSTQAEISGDGIADLDTGQLTLPETISLEQRLFLGRAQEDVFGHELVVGDVDEQVAFKEGLDDGGQHCRDDFERCGRDGGLRDEDARGEVVGVDVMRKRSHLFDPDVLLALEFHPDQSNLVSLPTRNRWRLVCFDHLLGGTRGEVHLLATAVIVRYIH